MFYPNINSAGPFITIILRQLLTLFAPCWTIWSNDLQFVSTHFTRVL